MKEKLRAIKSIKLLAFIYVGKKRDYVSSFVEKTRFKTYPHNTTVTNTALVSCHTRVTVKAPVKKRT